MAEIFFEVSEVLIEVNVRLSGKYPKFPNKSMWMVLSFCEKFEQCLMFLKRYERFIGECSVTPIKEQLTFITFLFKWL